MHPMSQVVSWRQIDLVPISFFVNTWCHRSTENCSRQTSHSFSQFQFMGSILNSMTRQCAAIADEMTKQCQFLVAHGGLYRAGQLARQGNVHSNRKRIEALPAVYSQELVVCRGADGAAKAGSHAVDWLMAGSKRAAHQAGLQAPHFGVQSQHPESILAYQLFDWSIDAQVGQVHWCASSKAAALTQVRELRHLRRATFHSAGQLRKRQHRDIQFSRQPLQAAADL